VKSDASKSSFSFGVSKAGDSVTKDDKSSAYPPMSTTAPKPFGGMKGSNVSSTSGSSGYPPISSKAPTPFGQPARSGGLSSIGRILCRGSARDILHLDTSTKLASEYEVQFWSLLNDFDKSLNLLEDHIVQDSSDSLSVKDIVFFKEEILCLSDVSAVVKSDALEINDILFHQNQSLLLLQSRLEDVSRQTTESKHIIDNQISNVSFVSSIDNIMRSQPLDIESEQKRRHISMLAMKTQCLISQTYNRFQFFDAILHTRPANNRRNLFMSMNSRNFSKEANRSIFAFLKDGFDRAKKIDSVSDSVLEKVSDFCAASNKKNRSVKKSESLLISSRHSRRTSISPLALPSSSQLGLVSSEISDMKSVSSFDSKVLLRSIKSRKPKTYSKSFSRRNLTSAYRRISDKNKDNIKFYSGHSQLMNTLDSSQGLQSTTLSLSLDMVSSSLRGDWQTNESNIDSKTMLSKPLTLPTQLVKLESSAAQRQALALFGTTPEKMAKVLETHDMETRDGTSQKKVLSKREQILKISETNDRKSDSKSLELNTKISSAKSSSRLPAKSQNLSLFDTPTSNLASDISLSSKSFSMPTKETDKQKRISDFQSKTDDACESSLTFKTEVKQTKLEDTTAKVNKLDDSITDTKDSKVVNDPGLFAKMGGLGDILSQSVTDNKSLLQTESIDTNRDTIKSTFGNDINEVNYHTLLLDFYTKYNPSKISEVAKTLLKYKGQEVDMFSKLAAKYKVPNPLDAKGTKINIEASSSIYPPSSKDYHSILSKFYLKYNPSKIGEVQKTLNKYRGHEFTLFQKLSSKYNVENPLNAGTNFTPAQVEVTKTPTPTPTPTPTTIFEKYSEQANMKGHLSGGNTLQTPFSINSSPFGSNNTNNTSTTFESARTNTFATTTTSTTPFGAASVSTNNQKQSGFGSISNTPQSQIATPNAGTIGGKSVREILLGFYQQYNPNKVAEVDKVLQKYAGQEEQLFRNLAKKYNIDPSMFGISISNNSTLTSTAGFSGSSTLSSPFGHSSGLGMNAPTGAFGSTSNTPIKSFSALSSNTQSGGGFGTFATGSTQSFGAFKTGNSSGFGGSPVPSFGAARR